MSDIIPVGLSLTDTAPVPQDPWRNLLPALFCLPSPRLGQEGDSRLPLTPYSCPVTHISLQQGGSVHLHVERQVIGLIDRFSCGHGSSRTETGQQQGQKAEGGWQEEIRGQHRVPDLPC